ncbi:hypothetical protein [Bremerella alba]|uniref:hypothetical protein n=1 Tax=Bremerella alba TaxID=980252 RepID=UPI001A9546BC|nr:hypothetical protein [Bremerella alba]
MVIRAILAVFIGLVVAFLLVIAVELFSAVVHPFPADFGGTEDEVCAHVEKYPAWVLAAVLPMWAMAVFGSVWIAQKIGDLIASLMVALLLLIAVGFNQWMLPYPIWFEVANYVAFPLATLGAIGINRTTVDSSWKEDRKTKSPSP